MRTTSSAVTVAFFCALFLGAAQLTGAPPPKKAPSLPPPSAAPLIVTSADAALSDAEDRVLQFQARSIFGELPKQMPGAENDTAAQIELGRRLYFEKALSSNGTQSCNDCHRIDGTNGGADARQTSIGATGKRGGRNSPGVLNAGYQLAQFWDGRSPDLADQAKGPVLNPVEMATTDAHAAMQQLGSAGYEPLFRAAFPGEANPFTFDKMANAIGAFERTLTSRGRFDGYLAGDRNAISPTEKRGLALYINNGCVRCHNGPTLGGLMYQPVGVAHPYAADDPGRQAVTKLTTDKSAFKVPILRNVSITGPYFHTGDVETVAEAIDLMGWHQLDRRFTNQEIDALARFITSLADDQRTKAAPTKSKAAAAWNPPRLADLPAARPDAALIRYGYDLVTDTYRYLGEPGLKLSGNQMACRNCHQESGTVAYGVTWMGVSSRYPRMSARTGSITTLNDRINECMQRSMNGKPLPAKSREMAAIVAYMNWLGEHTPAGNEGLLLVKFEPPERRADVYRGAEVYANHCQNCHGSGGQGYRATGSRNSGFVVPPLAGDGSYNSGAGTARVLTATAIVHSSMPLGARWDRPVISIDDAYDVAAYINSFDRPDLAGKEKDYPDRLTKPVDAAYGPYADPFSEDQHKYGPYQPIRKWYEAQAAKAKGGTE